MKWKNKLGIDTNHKTQIGKCIYWEKFSKITT